MTSTIPIFERFTKNSPGVTNFDEEKNIITN